VSEKIIKDELSRVEESATKSIYKSGVGFERCDDKGEKRAPKFVPASNYYKEEETIKSTKTHYPSSLKPYFNPKREVRKESSKSRKKAFVCIFCGRAGYLNEFCFRRKRVEKRRFDYAENSYRDEFLDFLPRSYSLASPHTSSRALSRFSHGLNHRSYNFGYVPRPYHGDHFLCRPGFPAGWAHTHFESRHLDGPRFLRRGSRPTQPNGEVQRTMKNSLGRMVKCWISKIYLTNPSTEPSTFSRPM
jgi:hypothetical protein